MRVRLANKTANRARYATAGRGMHRSHVSSKGVKARSGQPGSTKKPAKRLLKNGSSSAGAQALDATWSFPWEPINAADAKAAITAGNSGVLARYLAESSRVILAVAERAGKLVDRAGIGTSRFPADSADDDSPAQAEATLRPMAEDDGSILAASLRGLADVNARLVQAFKNGCLKFVARRTVGKPRQPSVAARDANLAMLVRSKAKNRRIKINDAIQDVADETGYRFATVMRAWAKQPKAFRKRS